MLFTVPVTSCDTLNCHVFATVMLFCVRTEFHTKLLKATNYEHGLRF